MSTEATAQLIQLASDPDPRSQLVDGLGSVSGERLSRFASDDDRDATTFSVGVLEDSLNTSGHGCREG